ncbi:uncharacterized protein [Amphiura filiformis]|uniref:uncharacterized protein n=1 Tax=Amphiura filiformis TaxID=82378 RepID=UPI003B214CB5
MVVFPILPTEQLDICSDIPTKRGCRGGKTSIYTPISRIIDNTSVQNKLNLSVWNAQSVCNKTDKLCDYVTDHDIDVLCLTETWLRPDDPVVIEELSPPGYSFINVPRNSEVDHHGGIGILFKSQLHLGLSANVQLPTFETFEYTVVSNTSRTFTIIVVYRPPPSKVNKLTLATYLENIDEFLSGVDLLPGRILLVGDFNIHYNKPSKSDVRQFSTILASAGLVQHIVGPTHRCGNTLDLVITRQDDLIMKRYIIDRRHFPKDHFMINCVLDLPKPSAETVTYTVRNYKLIDHDDFSNDLNTKMCHIANQEYDNVNALLADYNKACSEVLDCHAPPSTKSRRIRHRPAWYDESVDNARKQRRRSERKWRKSRSDANREEYLVSKQVVNDAIRAAKTVHYSDKLNNCSVKDMFKTVNELLNNTNKALPDTDCPEDLANEFGKYFVQKVTNIRNEVDGLVSNCNTSCKSCMKSDPVTCLFPEFKSVTDEELLKIIKKCPNKSCALDPMPTWLVQQHIDVLLPILCRIVNASLLSGVFPDNLHKAIVTPVLKRSILNRNVLSPSGKFTIYFEGVGNVCFLSIN